MCGLQQLVLRSLMLSGRTKPVRTDRVMTEGEAITTKTVLDGQYSIDSIIILSRVTMVTERCRRRVGVLASLQLRSADV